MTTATTWDALLGDDRPLTEDEVRKLQEDAFDNSEVTVAEQGDAEAAFKAIVDSYVQVRGRIDPEWHSVPETDYGDADWDLLGGTISVEWKEYDRCGDRDYFRRDFPLSDLWAPDWEVAITAEVEKRKEGEQVKLMVEKAKQAAARDARERAQLADLLDKYGVPEGYLARLDHG